MLICSVAPAGTKKKKKKDPGSEQEERVRTGMTRWNCPWGPLPWDLQSSRMLCIETVPLASPNSGIRPVGKETAKAAAMVAHH